MHGVNYIGNGILIFFSSNWMFIWKKKYGLKKNEGIKNDKKLGARKGQCIVNKTRLVYWTKLVYEKRYSRVPSKVLSILVSFDLILLLHNLMVKYVDMKTTITKWRNDFLKNNYVKYFEFYSHYFHFFIFKKQSSKSHKFHHIFQELFFNIERKISLLRLCN